MHEFAFAHTHTTHTFSFGVYVHTLVKQFMHFMRQHGNVTHIRAESTTIEWNEMKWNADAPQLEEENESETNKYAINDFGIYEMPGGYILFLAYETDDRQFLCNADFSMDTAENNEPNQLT